MIVDWSADVETRNYKISRCTDRRNLMDLLASILCILMIAGALVVSLSIRSRIYNLGFQVETLKEQEKNLLSHQNKLIIEEETLKRPQNIERLARMELGMEPLRPNQILPTTLPGIGERPDALVLASTQQANAKPRRPSSNY